MYVGIVFERISGWVGGGRSKACYFFFLSIFELRDRFDYRFLPFRDVFFSFLSSFLGCRCKFAWYDLLGSLNGENCLEKRNSLFFFLFVPSFFLFSTEL